MSTSSRIQARKATPQERKSLPLRTVTVVLTEAGYRCAVPTCRGILALDMHHIWEVNAGGGDDASNLLALCPTDHALYHRGTISSESMYVYKAMLVAMSQAFDLDAIDRLLFLSMYDKDFLIVSGDGALAFARLAAAGLTSVSMKANNMWELVTYAVNITEKGKLLIEAWRSGDRSRLLNALSAPVSDNPAEPNQAA